MFSNLGVLDINDNLIKAICMECPSCRSTLLQRNGHRKQVQCYKCKQCGRQFLETYRQVRYSKEIKQHCLDLYVQDLSIRAIERLTQIHHTTISYWIHKSDIATDKFNLKPTEDEQMIFLEDAQFANDDR